MADDINLLSGASAPSPKKDASFQAARAPKDEELRLHVPPPEIEPPAPPMVKESPKPIFSQKIAPVPSVAPKPAPLPSPAPPAMPKAVPLRTPVLPPKPSVPEEKDPGTLRVSLIATGAGAGLSEMALRRRLRLFALTGGLGLLLNGIVFGALLYQKSVVQKGNAVAEQTVRDLDAEIDAHEKDLTPVRDFQALVQAEAKVLANHDHWTQALKLLEGDALPLVQFGSLSGADTGAMSFDVFASDYTTLAKQIVAFRNDPRVQKAEVGTASADFGENDLLKGVRAQVTMTINPAVFRYQPPSS